MNIIIIDDDKIVETSLKTILEAIENINVVGTGNNGQEAIGLYNQYLPDIAMLDIQMPVLNGLDAAAQILQQHPTAKILFLTTFLDNDYIMQAIKIGAKGYILKQDFANIAPALNSVLSGQMVFGANIGQTLTTLAPQNGEILFNQRQQVYDMLGITEKEAAVIALVANGLNNKEIGQKLFLSDGTVRNYLSQILEKLSLRDRTQLAVFYYTGSISPMLST